MDELHKHYSAWHCIPAIGNNDRTKLFSYSLNPTELYALSTADLLALGLSAKACQAWRNFVAGPEQHPAWDRATDSRYALDGVKIIPIAHPAYPPLLREIDAAPSMLYVKGDIEILSKPQLAIVGSRRCSANGARSTFEFAKHIAASNICIVSGGALGIDAAAHRGAMITGSTIAVIGTGIDRHYPAEHRSLFEQIAEHGAVVSEFRPGVAPRAGHFPRRNRIIAGMAAGTLVMEAALKSGSLITAKLASDFNREVFALPGSINDPRSKGTHALIKQGAKLTESVHDILEEFPEVATKRSPREKDTDESAKDDSLLNTIGYSPTSLETIVQSCGIPMDQLMLRLLELELSGKLLQDSGRYCRVG